MNRPSISRVYLFMYDEIKDYTYTNNNLDKVTGYTALNVPVVYTPWEGGSFYQSSNTPTLGFFNHQLTLNFPRLEESKRQEFEALRGKRLTLFFVDGNAKTWVMGLNFPVKLNNISLRTGATDGQNDYTLEFNGVGFGQIKEADEPSENCFKSVNIRQAVRMNLTTILPRFGGSELTAILYEHDQQSKIFNLSPAIDPTQWATNPAQKLQDDLRLSAFFNSLNSIDSLTTSFSVDTLNMVVDFSAKNISNVSFLGTVTKSFIQDVLKIDFALSDALQNPNTEILVTSNQGDVYNEIWGTDLTGLESWIEGTAQSSVINVTEGFGNGDITFNIAIIGANCPELEHEFDWNFGDDSAISGCATDYDYQFFKAPKMEILLPFLQPTAKLDGELNASKVPKYQRMTWHIGGVVYEMYPNYKDWHSSTNQFLVDFKAMIQDVGGDIIDVSSISIIEESARAVVTLEFIGIDVDLVNPWVRVYQHGVSEIEQNDGVQYEQYWGVRLSGTSPNGSTVNVLDSHLNNIKGVAFNNVNQNNGYELITNSVHTNSSSIDDFGIMFAGGDSLLYGQTPQFTIETSGTACNVQDEILRPWFCNALTGSVTRSKVYEALLKIDSSGEAGQRLSFQFVESGAPVIVTVSKPIAYNSLQNTTKAINSSVKGLNVLHAEFRPTKEGHIFFVFEVQNGFSLSDLTALDIASSATLSIPIVNDVYTQTIQGNTNPTVAATWSGISAPMSSAILGTNDYTTGFGEFRADKVDLFEFKYDEQTDELTVSKSGDLVGFGEDITFRVWDAETYPQAGQLSWGYEFTIDGGNNTATVSNVIDEFQNFTNGFEWARYFVWTDERSGVSHVFTFHMEEGVNLVETKQVTRQYPNVWGTANNFKLIGTDIATGSIKSDFCDFDAGNGLQGSLELVGSKLYGTSYEGGNYGHGYVWEHDLSQGVATVRTVYHFRHRNSSTPTIANDGFMYLATDEGGDFNGGYIVKLKPSARGGQIVAHLNPAVTGKGFSRQFLSPLLRAESSRGFVNGRFVYWSTFEGAGNNFGRFLRFDTVTKSLDVVGQTVATQTGGWSKLVEHKGDVYGQTGGRLYKFDAQGNAVQVFRIPNIQTEEIHEITGKPVSYNDWVYMLFREDNPPVPDFVHVGRYNTVTGEYQEVTKTTNFYMRDLYIFNDRLYVVGLQFIRLYRLDDNAFIGQINIPSVTLVLSGTLLRGNLLYWRDYVVTGGGQPNTSIQRVTDLLTGTTTNVSQNFVY